MKFWNQQLTTVSSFSTPVPDNCWCGGRVAFVRGGFKAAVFNQLSVTATLKEEEITRWFEDQQRDFLLTTQFPALQANLKTLLSRESDADYKTAQFSLSI